MSWLAKVIARTSAHEGGYNATNPNSDGAGLAYGILQWTQASGNLGKVLAAMHAADPAAFAAIFRSPSELLAATARAGKTSVAGAHLWQEPWLSRFRAAGAHPAFQRAQDEVAATDQHMRAALGISRTLSVATERALALFFDTAVQQGPNGAPRVAEATRKVFLDQGLTTVPYNDLLATFVQKAADRARRSSPPDPSSPTASRWRQVGREWHLFGGKVDLYYNILARRRAILQDPNLSDEPIPLTVA
jgi:hypothetical protein